MFKKLLPMIRREKDDVDGQIAHLPPRFMKVVPIMLREESFDYIQQFHSGLTLSADGDDGEAAADADNFFGL